MKPRVYLVLAVFGLVLAAGAGGVARSPATAPGGEPVRSAAFDSLQVQRWYEQLRDHVWQVKAVRWTDYDEQANRIRIGVGTVEGKAQVEAAVKRAGVPPAAVIIDLPEGALSEADPLAGCRTREQPPAPEEALPFTLKVSPQVAIPGQELTFTVAGAQPHQVIRGIDAYLECWDGGQWSPRFTMFSEGPATEIYNPHSAIIDIGFDASRPGRVKLPDRLAAGWYRVRLDVSATEGGFSRAYQLWTLVKVGGGSRDGESRGQTAP